MIRAVLIAPGWPPALSQNGVTSYVAGLRPALEAAGADVRVISAALLPGLERVGRDPRVDYADDEPRPRGWYLQNRLLSLVSQRRADAQHLAARFEWTLRRLDRERPVDVYEIEEANGHGLKLLGRAPGTQVVRLHGPWFLCVPALGLDASEPDNQRRIEAEGRSIRRAPSVTSPSRFALRAVRDRYHASLPGARVIPNATPAVPEAARWRRDACEPGAILFVGRFDRLKGADTVIEAFGRVHARRPDVTLIFAGPDRGMPDGAGGTRSFAEHVERTLEPAARGAVRYLGPQTPAEIAALRRRAELTVVASRFETFGMTVIEALAAGSPVVAASGGAIGELLDWAADQLLFTPGDAEALAARLMAGLEEPGRVDALARRGLAIAAERYAPEVVAARTLDHYRALTA